MSDTDHNDRSAETVLYPEPTVVIGVGRFGLSVLERLGDDWRWLATSAAGDSSLKNLRLLSIRPEEGVDEERWRRNETPLARVAFAAGEDDLPTLAVHWAIVRSLGLIRFRDGAYQFALPRDAGVVEKGELHDTRRRRYFEWLSLDSDPLRSVERLHRLANRDPEVDLFLTPLVERVLHGQSPRLLLHLIARCRALLAGRDPSPWPWIHPHLPYPDENREDSVATVPFHSSWWSEDDALRLLEGVVPSPLPRIPHPYDTDDGSDDYNDDYRYKRTRDEDLPPVVVPRPFWPTPGDLATPLSPRRMLRVDWQTSGWVADELGQAESIEFEPVEASLFRFGFFDHDASSGLDTDQLGETLTDLGHRVHRGLLRIWLDLQRERDEAIGSDLEDRRRAGSETAIEQCLEILGELVVRPMLKAQDETPPERPEYRTDRWVDGPQLSDTASAPLKDSIVDTESPESMPERPLLERLADLGLHFGRDELGQHPLFRELTLNPGDLDDGARLTNLRRAINEETRHLVSFEHLKSYRQRPTRQPPRLTVYVVAEAREPFTRQALRPILRALHQELIRAYGPIFDNTREGFDRALSIVPIIWTPHPADAFGGDHPEANRIEEASILEAVHDLRRWAEALPSSRRCIPQIFINSRVTDSAVLGIGEAITQTRDFLSFQIRNELGKDAWLREAAVGYRSDDLFSTFTCVQIDFPAERAREYLANRLSREALARLRQTGRDENQDLNDDELTSITPPPEDLLEPPQKRLKKKTATTARSLSAAVDDRLNVDAWTTTVAIKDAFDEDFEDHLYDNVHNAWQALTRNRGAMDSMVNELRRASARHLQETVLESRRGADRLIEEHATRGGIKSARAGFRRLLDSSRTILEDSEAERRECQDLCLRHDIPDSGPIGRARQNVVNAAEQKPDKMPMIMGFILWGAMAPALGAPLSHAVARAFNLQDSTGPIEIALGPAGWLLGGLLVFFPVFFVLRTHMDKAVNAVNDSIADLSNAVRDVVEGSDSGLFNASPSIRSFFAARLRLTAALAGRNFADRIHDRVARDDSLASRLFSSIDVQQRRLRQRAEALGVRPTATGEEGHVDDDVRAIFDSSTRSRAPSLLDPEHLVDHYRRHFPTDNDLDAAIPAFLESAGGFERWREEACLSDTEKILGYGRLEFADLVITPIGAHALFEDEVGKNLAGFVARNYSNVGFGARFVGYEGFDTDGLRRLADTSLVVHPHLRPAFEKARRHPDAPPTTETLDVIEAKILPNTAYILSLVQGIHARSVHNLRRHEAFYDRLELPDPATPWMDGPMTLAGRRRTRGELPERVAPGTE